MTHLLDSARLDQGNIPLDIVLNAADELLGAVVQHFGGRPDRSRLVVSIEDPSSPAFGRFDLVHSIRILANLVDNALKYSPAGCPVELTASTGADTLVFRVADRGHGIAQKDVDRIFTPFVQSGEARFDHSLGLGLSISRRLAEAQGGTLTCYPREGGGTVFELRLPAVDPLTLS